MFYCSFLNILRSVYAQRIFKSILNFLSKETVESTKVSSVTNSGVKRI
jgi:hypothetical protein